MKRGELILITGGIASGKSQYALRLAEGYKKVTFIGTAQPIDLEMKRRIKRHKEHRPKRWRTIEEPIEIKKAISRVKSECFIIDCLGLWVANLMEQNKPPAQIYLLVRQLIKFLKSSASTFIFVTNEVGYSLVSTHKLGRAFQEVLGRTNQMIAQDSDVVYLLVAGLKLRIKPQFG